MTDTLSQRYSDKLHLDVWQSRRATRDGMFLVVIEERIRTGQLPPAALAALRERLALYWCDAFYGDALRIKERTKACWFFDQKVCSPTLSHSHSSTYPYLQKLELRMHWKAWSPFPGRDKLRAEVEAWVDTHVDWVDGEIHTKDMSENSARLLSASESSDEEEEGESSSDRESVAAAHGSTETTPRAPAVVNLDSSRLVKRVLLALPAFANFFYSSLALMLAPSLPMITLQVKPKLSTLKGSSSSLRVSSSH